MARSTLDKGKNVVIDLNETPEDSELYEFGTCYAEYGHRQGKSNSATSQPLEMEKTLQDFSAEEVLQMKFNSEDEAGKFYNTYAKFVGFSVRKDDLKCDKNHIPVSRKWVCSRQGFRAAKYLDRDDRAREPRGITRVGCMALFRVKYDRNSEKWVVKEFMNDHNHPLVPPSGVPFLRSHRRVKSPDIQQATALRSVGIRTSQIRDFMLNQAGGYQNVGFTRADLYNAVASQRREEMIDGDAEGALAYLSAKEELDPLFYFRYSVDDDTSLNCLFWADSTSRVDYTCFGDVLVFDTTYRTNAYKKPFVILAGVNHHNATCIFGCALLSNETVDTYVWVLETFMDAMDNKKPISVVTDGDKAMAAAIERIFPHAKHRLCRWHLERNALQNIHAENFLHEFKNCMCSRCTPEEFDIMWESMVHSFGLQNNNWISDVYAKRWKWAEAFLRGHFFGGIKSTQRSESLNGYLNRFLKTRLRLYEFVRQYDRGVSRIRETEANDNHYSEHSTPVLTTSLRCLEQHAASLYTRSIFFKVRDNIKAEGLFFVVQKIQHCTHSSYYLSKYTKPTSSWNVIYDYQNQTINCNCMKLQSVGLPCSHIITVLKTEHITEFPPCTILQRWTVTAKSTCPPTSVPQTSRSISISCRYGGLMSMCSRMCYYATQLPEDAQELRTTITALTNRMKQRHETREASQVSASNDRDNDTMSSMKFGVVDPKTVTTKGNPGRVRKNLPIAPRRCSNCHGTGHTIRKCPQLTCHADDPHDDMPFSQPGGSQHPIPSTQEDDHWNPTYNYNVL